MGEKALRIVALMVGGALIIGLVLHASGTASVINSVTGFLGTGLNAELGHVSTPASNQSISQSGGGRRKGMA